MSNVDGRISSSSCIYQEVSAAGVVCSPFLSLFLSFNFQFWSRSGRVGFDILIVHNDKLF